MFTLFSASKKILGMNARNLTYIRPNNRKKAKRLADEKITSKKLLRKAGVPVPRLIAQISSRRTLENFDWSILPSSFVLKPNRGLGGEGIIVIYGRKKGSLDTWVRSNGRPVSIADLKMHIGHILDGEFSLSGTPDIAFFEERLKLSKEFRPYAYKGIPDIRVIVYNKVPVMAMLRLPTEESDGKANLQQGGIGVGIDMARGVTTTAVQGKSRIVEYVPNTRLLLSGIKIPHWDEILHLAIKSQIASGLGYLGADIAIDRDNGPVILELNARPGLSIQVANLAGLKRRLERVEGLKINSIARGIAVGKNLFGGEIEEELESVSGKSVIGSVENVEIIGTNDAKITTKAKIDTGAYSTSIDTELARKLGFGSTIDAFSKIDLAGYDLVPQNEQVIKDDFMRKYKKNIPHITDIAVVFSSSGASIRPVVKAEITLDKRRMTVSMNIIDRENLTYDMIIGKRNLGKFLIDVSK
ncbi:MAG: sugar-transfer associated ATP-grasp domain-containing protein [Parcubacteria group bacterium]|jgi:alpha-L-glutamate ligase-like protein